MKKDKLISEVQDFLIRSDRDRIELFLIKILYFKLNQFTLKSYSIEELRGLMNSLPHFATEEQFMMLSSYEQRQIFKAYKEVFLALINEINTYPIKNLKLIVNQYVELMTDSDLAAVTKSIKLKNLAA